MVLLQPWPVFQRSRLRTMIVLGMVQPTIVFGSAGNTCTFAKDAESSAAGFMFFMTCVFLVGLAADTFFGVCIRKVPHTPPEPEAEPTAEEADATPAGPAPPVAGGATGDAEELLAEIMRLRLQLRSGGGLGTQSPDIPALINMTGVGRCYHTADHSRALRSASGHRALRPCSICMRAHSG